MSDAYFWLTSGEDGTDVRRMTKAEVERELAAFVRDGNAPEFLRRVPESDKGCWIGVPHNAVLIVKGEIVVPTPTKVVEKLEI